MKQYLKSYISFSLGMWFRAGVSFFSIPVISYLIIPEEFGKSAMFTLAFSIITGFMFLGTDQSFMRFFNEYGEEERSGHVRFVHSVHLWKTNQLASVWKSLSKHKFADVDHAVLGGASTFQPNPGENEKEGISIFTDRFCERRW